MKKLIFAAAAVAGMGAFALESANVVGYAGNDLNDEGGAVAVAPQFLGVGAEGIKLKDIVPSTETGTSLRRKIQIQLLDNAGKVSTFYRWEGQGGKTWIAGNATTDMGDVEIPAGQGLWVLNTANCAATLRIPAPEL